MISKFIQQCRRVNVLDIRANDLLDCPRSTFPTRSVRENERLIVQSEKQRRHCETNSPVHFDKTRLYRSIVKRERERELLLRGSHRRRQKGRAFIFRRFLGETLQDATSWNRYTVLQRRDKRAINNKQLYRLT